MQNSPVFLTRMIFEAPAYSIRDLALFPGEVLKVQVNGLTEEGLVSLLIKGRIVQALSETRVQPGQELYLMVDEAREGRVYLKLLTPEAREQVESRQLLNRLQEIGIPARQENLPVVMKLIEAQLPVTRHNFEQLTRMAALLGEVSPKTLDIAAFALSRGVPVSKEALAALLQYMEGDDLARLVAEVLQQVNSNGRNSRTIKAAVAAESQSVAPAPGMKAVHTRASEAAPLKFSSDLLGSSRSVIRSGADEPGMVATAMNDVIKTQGSIMKGWQLLGTLLETLQLPAGDQEQLATKIRIILQNQPAIIRGLLWLEEALKNAPQVQSGTATQNLVEKIEAMEKELAGQRIVNFVSRGTPDNPVTTYYFSFPVPAEKEQQLCQVRINHEGNPGDLRYSDRISLVVSLDTENLGMVLFQATWRREQKLELQGVVQKDEVRHYLEARGGDLVARLEQLGYQVEHHGVKVAAREDPVFEVKRPAGQGGSRMPMSIDITI